MGIMDNLVQNVEGIAQKIMGKQVVQAPIAIGEEKKEPEIKIINNDQELLSQILKKINELMEGFNVRLNTVEGKMKDLENKLSNDTEINAVKEEIKQIHTTLEEFSKLYELVCRQYDPFTPEKGAVESNNTMCGISASEISAAIPQATERLQKSIVEEFQQKKEFKEKDTDLLGNQINKKSNPQIKEQQQTNDIKKVTTLNTPNNFSKVLEKGYTAIKAKDIATAQGVYAQIMDIYKTVDAKEKPKYYKEAMDFFNEIKKIKQK